jgi:protein arginine kinase
VELDELARTSGEWLRGTGPESDIVISSRIRLARNLADFPFISRANASDRAEIERTLRSKVIRIQVEDELQYVDVNKLPGIDRQFLVERQLISREHADSEGARGVAISPKEQVSLMINEEDHLRIQVMHSGLDLMRAWEEINGIDDAVES